MVEAAAMEDEVRRARPQSWRKQSKGTVVDEDVRRPRPQSWRAQSKAAVAENEVKREFDEEEDEVPRDCIDIDEVVIAVEEEVQQGEKLKKPMVVPSLVSVPPRLPSFPSSRGPSLPAFPAAWTEEGDKAVQLARDSGKHDEVTTAVKEEVHQEDTLKKPMVVPSLVSAPPPLASFPSSRGPSLPSFPGAWTEEGDKAVQLRAAGNDCFKAGQYSEALEMYSKALELDANNAGLLANRGAAYMMLGKWETALEDTRTAASLDPLQGRSHERCARCFLLLDRLQEGIAFCSKRMASLSAEDIKTANWKPFVATAHRLTGTAGMFQDLEVDMKTLANAEAGFAVARNVLTTVQDLERKLQPTEEGSLLKRHMQVLKVKAWLLPVAGKTGQSSQIRKQWAEAALKEAHALVNDMPGDPAALYWKACALLRLSQRVEARESLKNAMQAGNGEHQLSEDLLDSLRAGELQKTKGNEAFQNRDWKAALLHYDAAAQADALCLDADFSASVFCNRGAVHSKLGQAQAAVDDLTLALAMSPRYAKALFRRGLAYLELESYSKADADFGLVEEITPDFIGLPEHRRRARMWARQPPKKNFYAVLGVPFDVDAKEVKRAYRVAALKWHPDKNIEEPEQAERMFKDVQSAYETLSDKKLRQEYDYGSSSDSLGGSGNWHAEYPTRRTQGFSFDPFSRSRAQPKWNQPNDFNESFASGKGGPKPDRCSNAWSKGGR